MLNQFIGNKKLLIFFENILCFLQTVFCTQPLSIFPTLLRYGPTISSALLKHAVYTHLSKNEVRIQRRCQTSMSCSWYYNENQFIINEKCNIFGPHVVSYEYTHKGQRLQWSPSNTNTTTIAAKVSPMSGQPTVQHLWVLQRR